MKQINYLSAMPELVERMSDRGVFLTVGGAKPNTMTIGWATIGYSWYRPVFMAMVRPSRYTYDLLNQSGRFTVSVPRAGELLSELAFVGTKSGRDVDKFSGHGLTAAPAQMPDSFIVAQCPLHFECAVIDTEDMLPDALSEAIAKRAYPTGDLHRLFFGEILHCYTT